MALQYTTVPIKDFGAGIDQQSSENQIAEGFCEDLLNCDPNPEGFLSKRTGYEGYAGDLPLRVKQLDFENGLLCFTFDESVNLSQTRSSPIVVFGQSDVDAAGGSIDFVSSVNTVQYYDQFSLVTSKQEVANSGNPENVTLDLSTSETMVYYTRSTEFVNNSNELLFPHSSTIDISEPSVTGQIINGTSNPIDVFIYAAAADHSATYTTDGSGTIVIQATGGVNPHGLDEFSIETKVFEIAGGTGDYTEVLPGAIVISKLSRAVTISGLTPSTSYRVMLKEQPINNVVTGAVSSGAQTVVNIFNLSGDFPYFTIFRTDDDSNLIEVVQPGNITVDAANNQAVISFANDSASGANFSIYYGFADVQVNKICVSPNLATANWPSDPYETTDVNLTIWGIKQDEAYTGSTASRPGWVNHIDAYRAVNGAYMVAGLGGNLFREAQRTEVRNLISTFGADYSYPLWYPDMQSRVNNEINIGPAFYSTTQSPLRTRGWVKASNPVAQNKFGLESIIWQSGTTVRYTFNVEDLEFNGTPIATSATDEGFEDILSVQGAGYSQFNGSFKILDWSGTGDTSTLWFDVENTAVINGDYDIEQDAAGNGGIFTDQIPLNGASEFVNGDQLQSTFFNGTQVYTVEKTNSLGAGDGQTISVSGLFDPINLPQGLRITAKRTSSIIPLRTASTDSANDTVQNIVRGDMVTYSDYERKFEVLRVNTLDTTAATVRVTDGVATVTLAAGTTANIAPGQKLLFVRAGIFEGEQTVTALTSETAFQFSTTSADIDTDYDVVVKGKTIEIDEAIEFQDAIENTKQFEVKTRWIPIELPVSSKAGTLTPVRKTTYFDSGTFSEQPFLRSAMVSSNMYFTDGDGAVHKFDGGNIYRAGLIRWQPHLFVTSDTTPGDPDNDGVISFDPEEFDVNSIDGSTFVVDEGTQANFQVGLNIRSALDGAVYTVTNVSESGRVRVDDVITGTQTTTAVTGVTGSNQFDVTAGTGTNFAPNDRIFHTDDNKSYTVESVAANSVTVTDTISGTGAGQLNKRFYIRKAQQFRYYFRLNAIDANRNRLGSAVTGAQDFVVELFEPAQIKMRLLGMPIWDIYDYDRIELEIYRTPANDPAGFSKVANLPVDFTKQYGYVDWTDSTSDTSLGQRDDLLSFAALADVSPQLAAELATQISEPLRAKYLTSAGNRLILANLKDYPELNIQLDNIGPRIDTDALNGLEWQFRRDATSTVTGTDTNVESTLQLKFTTTSGSSAITVSAGTSFTISALTGYTGWVYLFHNTVADGNEIDFCGWWKCTAGVVTWDGTPAAGATMQYATGNDLTTGSSDIVPVFLGEDGNYSMFNGNTGTDAASVELTYEFQAMRRLANAINFMMRYSTDPWMTAAAGNEFTAGQLLIRSPKILTTNPEVVLPSTYTTAEFNIFVNNFLRSPGDEVSAEVETYPSRLIASVTNYAEVFNNPRAVLDTDSLTVVDVNSADGQEITGVIPFFGDSAFGSAQKGGVIVVFKENSIYLVNLAAGEPVQKIESQGLGCTAPYSIAVTRDGIMFANESGIFRLTRDLRIEYIGQKVERIWQRGGVNLDQLSLAQGTHFAVGRQYKLSVPASGASVNSDVLVYNHTREYRGKGFGSWTRYDNFPATGWANLQTDAFFGSTLGRVYRLRNEGTETDFRDGADGYVMTATMRAMDFGDSGRRKAISKAIFQFRTIDDLLNTTISSAPDLGNDFTEMDAFEVRTAKVEDSLSDDVGGKVATVAFSPNRRKCVYFQLKVENSTKDEALEIAGVDLRVGGLTEEGITSAAQTKS